MNEYGIYVQIVQFEMLIYLVDRGNKNKNPHTSTNILRSEFQITSSSLQIP